MTWGGEDHGVLSTPEIKSNRETYSPTVIPYIWPRRQTQTERNPRFYVACPDSNLGIIFTACLCC